MMALDDLKLVVNKLDDYHEIYFVHSIEIMTETLEGTFNKIVFPHPTIGKIYLKDNRTLIISITERYSGEYTSILNIFLLEEKAKLSLIFNEKLGIFYIKVSVDDSYIDIVYEIVNIRKTWNDLQSIYNFKEYPKIEKAFLLVKK
jgi:hypothetical protein